jgi:hypothetical protein
MWLDLEFEPARDADYLAGTSLQIAKFCEKSDAPFFGHEQHLAVGVVKIPIAHAFVEGINVDTNSDLRKEIAIARDRRNAVNEICRFGWYGEWIPAKLIRRR